MQRLESNTIGIDQGDVVLFSDFEDDGEMWRGDGPRQTRMGVAYSGRYIAVPFVTVSVSMLDMSKTSNIRWDVQTEDITITGFNIIFRTWGDTQVARCRVAWQSIGPVQTEDTWDL